MIEEELNRGVWESWWAVERPKTPEPMMRMEEGTGLCDIVIW